jgi:hypothetical protein
MQFLLQFFDRNLLSLALLPPTRLSTSLGNNLLGMPDTIPLNWFGYSQ